MRAIDADKLMPKFMEKAFTMKDRHGVKLGENWLKRLWRRVLLWKRAITKLSLMEVENE